MRRYLFGTMLVVLVVTSMALGRGQTPGGPPTKAYRFERIANGVHFATGTGLMTTMSNSMVIENSDHVMLVDTSVTPAAARALVAQIKEEITPKPIKYTPVRATIPAHATAHPVNSMCACGQDLDVFRSNHCPRCGITLHRRHSPAAA